MGDMLLFPDRPLIFIVVDDRSVSDVLVMLMGLDGFATRHFDEGRSFLEAIRTETPDCVILDLQLPGYNGLSVLEDLRDLRFRPPVIAISGHCDVPTAVAAMKRGALDFLGKPFTASAVMDRVREAVQTYRRSIGNVMQEFGDFPGQHLLTSREREVLIEVANGASNKEAGRRLGISPRTIEVHRARIMTKLGAKNAADLMRIVLSKAGSRPRSRATAVQLAR